MLLLPEVPELIISLSNAIVFRANVKSQFESTMRSTAKGLDDHLPNIYSGPHCIHVYIAYIVNIANTCKEVTNTCK